MAGGNSTIDLHARGPLVAPEFQLAVVGQEDLTMIPLPPGSDYLIGRGERAHVRLNDEGVSREHAKLAVSNSAVQIEDLGGRNGTFVAGVRLEPRTPTLLHCDTPVSVGSTVLMLQQLVSVPQRRRIWSHVYFLGRLEEECFKAPLLGAPFAVMRLRLARDVNDLQIGTLLSPALSPFDLVARYGARDWELLLHGLDRAAAEAAAARVVAELGPKMGEVARWAIAVYGVDGRDPASLLAAASTAVLGGGAATTPTAFVAAGPRIQNVLQLVGKAATARSNTVGILILGETGVGKTMLARWAHDQSPRAGGPFRAINLGELAGTLVESELFGHRKGAFTGPTDHKPGLIELADGGTLFLDEIGELPPEAQVKLLGVLQDRRLRRIGEIDERPLDVRVIAATSRDLHAEMEAGRFRRELYHRIATIEVVVPPLRKRISEIEPLARSFLARFASDEGLPAAPELSGEALAALERYAWPGNIRELENVIRRAVIISSGALIEPGHLGPAGETHDPDVDDGAGVAGDADLSDLDEAQLRDRKNTIALLEKNQWVVERAIKASGLQKTAFYRKLRRLRIPTKSSGTR
jgi:DNA-binding NtrC family response regulator